MPSSTSSKLGRALSMDDGGAAPSRQLPFNPRVTGGEGGGVGGEEGGEGRKEDKGGEGVREGGGVASGCSPRLCGGTYLVGAGEDIFNKYSDGYQRCMSDDSFLPLCNDLSSERY